MWIKDISAYDPYFILPLISACMMSLSITYSPTMNKQNVTMPFMVPLIKYLKYQLILCQEIHAILEFTHNGHVPCRYQHVLADCFCDSVRYCGYAAHEVLQGTVGSSAESSQAEGYSGCFCWGKKKRQVIKWRIKGRISQISSQASFKYKRDISIDDKDLISQAKESKSQQVI